MEKVTCCFAIVIVSFFFLRESFLGLCDVIVAVNTTKQRFVLVVCKVLGTPFMLCK